MEFSDWITQEYIKWRGNSIGHKGTITEFSKWLGVPQSLMSQWMKKGGKIPTKPEYLLSLADHLGTEVYAVLGIAPPEPPKRITAAELLEKLNPREREAFVAASIEAVAKIQDSGISPNSSEAADIFREVYKRAGF